MNKTSSASLACLDFVLSLLVVLPAWILLGYRRLGSARLPRTTKRLRSIGVFPIRNHYYEPLFMYDSLERSLSEDRDLPGIDLNAGGQLAFLNTLSLRDELVALALDGPASGITGFTLRNGSFESGDAEFLYQFIRQLRPARIIEIGSGSSTRIASFAMKRNAADRPGGSGKHTCIEPYEQPWLETLPGIEVLRRRLEDCDIDWATHLRAGDLLFVDSSHVIRPQGDVLKEYLEIFPRLASGVYVQIHDVFTPKDYLQRWMTDDVKFWNEQYLLEALLSNSGRYEVVAALNYLKHHHFQHLKRVCPYLTEDREPGSFYIRVR